MVCSLLLSLRSCRCGFIAAFINIFLSIIFKHLHFKKHNQGPKIKSWSFRFGLKVEDADLEQTTLIWLNFEDLTILKAWQDHRLTDHFRFLGMDTKHFILNNNNKSKDVWEVDKLRNIIQIPKKPIRRPPLREPKRCHKDKAKIKATQCKIYIYFQE